MQFDDAALKRHLVTSPNFRRLAFAMLLCQRGWPALEKFGRDTGFDVSPHPHALNEGWLCLGGGDRMRAEHAAMAQQCLDSTPDTEDFDHPLTSAALDGGLSIGLMMEFLVDDDVDHIVEAASLAHDTADLFEAILEDVDPHSLRGWTAGLQFVQRELRQQADDLAFLESLPNDVPNQMAPVVREYAARTPDMLPLGVVRRR